jgi:hypothetical protein
MKKLMVLCLFTLITMNLGARLTSERKILNDFCAGEAYGATDILSRLHGGYSDRKWNQVYQDVYWSCTARAQK